MYFPKPSLNENDMAIIERGDTAAHSIEAGQYVSWHGKTGKAKAAILQGATLDDTLFDYSENGTINELSASLKYVELLATTTSQSRVTINLSKPYTDFSFLQIEIANTESPKRHNALMIATATIDSDKRYNFDVAWGTSWGIGVSMSFPNSTQVYTDSYNDNGWSLGYLKVYGIR